MKACPTLRRQRLQPFQRSPAIGDEDGFACGVGDAAPAVSGRQVEPVRQRAAPVRSRIDPRQPVLDPHQAAHVARVAVGIPPGGVGDH
ncbi:MAG TPA: hypothetical protein VIO61_07070 [Anaerolineaceae bacterium]